MGFPDVRFGQRFGCHCGASPGADRSARLPIARLCPVCTRNSPDRESGAPNLGAGSASYLARLASFGRNAIGGPSNHGRYHKIFLRLCVLFFSRCFLIGPSTATLAILAEFIRRIAACARRWMGATIRRIGGNTPLLLQRDLSHDEAGPTGLPQKNLQQPDFFNPLLSKRPCRRLA